MCQNSHNIYVSFSQFLFRKKKSNINSYNGICAIHSTIYIIRPFFVLHSDELNHMVLFHFDLQISLLPALRLIIQFLSFCSHSSILYADPYSCQERCKVCKYSEVSISFFQISIPLPTEKSCKSIQEGPQVFRQL